MILILMTQDIYFLEDDEKFMELAGENSKVVATVKTNKK
jgi:hypothetical protein